MDVSDWSRCVGEAFLAFGKKHGDAVKHGDNVVTRYGSNRGNQGSLGTWVEHESSRPSYINLSKLTKRERRY